MARFILKDAACNPRGCGAAASLANTVRVLDTYVGSAQQAPKQSKLSRELALMPHFGFLVESSQRRSRS